MAESPTSATTFLFTDIERSTEKWEREPARMAQAVARHDALLREIVVKHHGRVIKTTGDGMYAAFDDAADCVRAVVLIQISLADPDATAGIPIFVRCGLHAGAALERDNDFFGSTVNRAARIMDAAHGGQALMSQTVADLVEGRLPENSSLRDLGNLRLQGMSTPEHVFQIVHPRLRQEFPALRALESTPHNLPEQTTSFIGRERELRQAEEMLGAHRLVTLLGIGGLGKTRLALRIGSDLLDEYADGVWFVDLAPIRDPALIVAETARVLGVREEPGSLLVQTICAQLKPRTLLLILDNCEHLITSAATLANALLREVPGLRIVATSREALHVPGEQTFPVLPLPLPNPLDGVALLSTSTAVQLFVERAKLHKPQFTLTERDALAVAEVVGRLEGIPLAIELAAARMRSLSLAEINVRLNDRYKLLTGGGRVLLERQQTLRALVDWSYDLLNDHEQILLARLSVFAGGLELTAAEQVCGIEPMAQSDVIDLLASLVEKSLVMHDDSSGRSRYRLLETIRDYAHEKLALRDEYLKVAAPHCDYYLSMAKSANRALRGPDRFEWTHCVETELDNVRAAIALALEEKVDPVKAVKFEVALLGFWILGGYSTEGRRYVRDSLANPGVRASNVAHAHALYVGAALANSQSDHAEAQQMLESCLALRREIGNHVDIAATLSTLSQVYLNEGDAAQARVYEEEALAIFRQLGNRIGEAIGLLHLGEISAFVEDDEGSRLQVERCIAIAREIGHLEIQAACERMLGELALDTGHVRVARQHFERSLSISKDGADKRGEATALWWLGKADLADGDYAGSRSAFIGAVRAFKAFEMNAELFGCLEGLAKLAATQGLGERATGLCAAVATYRERFNLPRAPRHERRWRSELAAMREATGDARYEQAWSEGRAWPIDAAIGHALSTVSEPNAS
jgi:predicted ATPase/class 3 adenylate cyclase